MCDSNHTKKNGKFRSIQKYKCLNCDKQFQSKRRKSKFQTKLWNEYIWKKQTVSDLASKHKRSKKWIGWQLDKVQVKAQNNSIKPQPIIIVADTTFFDRTYGIMVLREPNLKKNLYWQEIINENLGIYWKGRAGLERQGFAIQAVVVDGKKCLKSVFLDLPIQMCHFHQTAIITRYLTRRPKLEAGKELRKIALSLTTSNKEEFTILLNNWFEKWKEFLKEKTVNPETGRWFYAHKRLRSAYRSLKTNLPYLFTYQKYPELNIPNTTNSLDGTFAHFKSLLRMHRGLKRARRYKVICEILGK